MLRTIYIWALLMACSVVTSASFAKDTGASGRAKPIDVTVHCMNNATTLGSCLARCSAGGIVNTICTGSPLGVDVPFSESLGRYGASKAATVASDSLATQAVGLLCVALGGTSTIVSAFCLS